jgi:hypothetical protein
MNDLTLINYLRLVDGRANLMQVFPSSCRASHDTIYGAIEKLLSHMPECSEEEQQQLWGLVDHFKLSPSMSERALNNPMFLSQPEILESVLQHHSQELSKVDETDGHHLRHIMHKVINASLKLLEENSRRSREILELQKQCGELLTTKSRACSASRPRSPGRRFSTASKIARRRSRRRPTSPPSPP